MPDLKEKLLQELDLEQLKILAKEVHVQDVNIDGATKQGLIRRLRWFSYLLLKKRSNKIKLNKKL